ncbi:MAG: zinc ribbon domain-containing protein [Deltaproteobacteria bacterium]|nr:zinc ribbon domain-containing protein [Deltaproteobacteria bacterium]MBI3388858.1 zinc ribbon domain-containing protein [Deltaproteobacteria bacterium]
MPIYEYQCAKCGPFERIQKFSDATLKRCPTCKGKVSKLISNTSFQLKGSGWYVTDYARKDSGGSKTNGGAETKAASDSGKTEPSSKTESSGKVEGPSKGASDTKPSKEASAA